MQKEYKEAMDKISLSDSDKARILENVKKAYENSSETVVSMQSRPRFSAHRWGMIAVAFVAVVISALVIRAQFFTNGNEDDPLNPTIVASGEEEVWEELESIDAIGKETDCRTYTLSNVSKSYKVKKVEVAKKQKHVKITYHSKKHQDEILLEYKEEENAPEVTNKFEEEKELTKEKVGDSEVTMYGDRECNAMTWQKESCTFAVTMEKACSTKKAAKLVSGTKERKRSGDRHGNEDDGKKKKLSRNAVGWDGNEKESTAKQRRNVLTKIFDLYGFRVTIEEPATKISYKIVEDFESFSFLYPEMEELDKRRIIGYAGKEGSPSGVLDDFTESETLSVNGASVQVYADDEGEEIYTFTMRDVCFTLLVGNVEVDDTTTMLSGLMSVIHVSLDSGKSEEEVEEEEESEDDEEEVDISANYQEEAQKIQYAVADGSLKKLSAYMQFPLTIKGGDVTVSSAKEFQNLDASLLFTSAWVDSVVAYDVSKIKSDTKTFTMGDSTNALVCKIKNNSVVITELRVSESVAEPTATPLEE